MSKFTFEGEHVQEIMVILRDIVKAESTDENLRYRADQYWKLLMTMLDVDETFEVPEY